MMIEPPLFWVVWLLVGALTALLLNKMLPPGHPILLDLVLGAIGGLLGGLLFAITGAAGTVRFELLSILFAVGGTLVMLAILRWTGLGRKLLSH